MLGHIPSVSILVPVRNEEKNIGQCIDKILENDYPGEKTEILIIDGESNDSTSDIVKDYIKLQKGIRLYTNPARTPYTGLNIGLKHATGDIILRIDARSIVPRNYIRLCVQSLLETGADNVGGVQRQIGRTAKQKAVAAALSHPFGVGNAWFRIGGKSGYVDTVYLGCFRRDIFDRIGNYDDDGPVVSEDSGMNRRIIDAGGKVYLNKDIVVDYYAKDTFKELCRQYFIYGGAKAHIFLKYKHLTARRQFVPIIFILCIIFSLLLSMVDRRFFWLFGGLCGVYIVSDMLCSFWISVIKKKDMLLFPFLICVFPCIHFPWAIGFIKRVLEGSRATSHWRKK